MDQNQEETDDAEELVQKKHLRYFTENPVPGGEGRAWRTVQSLSCLETIHRYLGMGPTLSLLGRLLGTSDRCRHILLATTKVIDPPLGSCRTRTFPSDSRMVHGLLAENLFSLASLSLP